jgi:hypothetical protein
VYTFTQRDECIDFITEIDHRKMFLILPDTMSQQMVPLIQDIPLLDSVYIFCGSKTLKHDWSDYWKKIKGLYTQITSICEAIQASDKLCNQNNISISVISADQDGSSYSLDQLEPSFMYTRLLKEILLESDHNEQAIKDFTQLWRSEYVNNSRKLSDISEFELNYSPKASIWWYTKESFVHEMLNLSLRKLDAETILKMSFFLCDLHRQIKSLHKTQVSQYHGKTFTVYRGQRLLRADFEKLQKNNSGLMSFNNFLSTSADKDISLIFPEGAIRNIDTVSVLFQITIDPIIVFRIGEVRQIDNNYPFYQVDVTLTSDEDRQLHQLTEHI